MNTATQDRFIYQLVNSLLCAMETRDAYTVSHQNNVSIIARRIAQQLGLTSFEVEGLRIAGQVHDIGKIAIPSQLLSKIARLNEEELMLIKTHVLRSVEILQPIDFPWPIADIVSQHHERLDGSGYPRGLKGDEISLSGRILAIADVTDAVINSRPYRSALSKDALFTILTEDNHQLYDKTVVTALQALLQSSTSDSLSETLFTY